MKPSLEEVWELIDTLTLTFEEKKKIYKRMQSEVDSRLLDILDNVSERAGNEPVSLDEVIKEIETVRSEN
jgi:hypothetical protein